MQHWNCALFQASRRDPLTAVSVAENVVGGFFVCDFLSQRFVFHLACPRLECFSLLRRICIILSLFLLLCFCFFAFASCFLFLSLMLASILLIILSVFFSHAFLVFLWFFVFRFSLFSMLFGLMSSVYSTLLVVSVTMAWRCVAYSLLFHYDEK